MEVEAVEETKEGCEDAVIKKGKSETKETIKKGDENETQVSEERGGASTIRCS